MDAGSPDTINQLPNVMKPGSGSYGDVADLDRLKGQLDLPGTGSGSPSTQPAPAPPPGAPQGQGVPPQPKGIPDVLMGPTTAPDVPASTPLTMAPTPTAVNGAQARLRALDALANNPMASEATREWAQVVLKKLVGS